MSISKCVFEPTTRLMFSEINCDIEARPLEVPEDMLLKQETVLAVAFKNG